VLRHKGAQTDQLTCPCLITGDYSSVQFFAFIIIFKINWSVHLQTWHRSL